MLNSSTWLNNNSSVTFCFEIKSSSNNTLRSSKYVPDRIDGEYVNSLGGKASDSDSGYVFYVAWRSK